MFGWPSLSQSSPPSPSFVISRLRNIETLSNLFRSVMLLSPGKWCFITPIMHADVATQAAGCQPLYQGDDDEARLHIKVCGGGMSQFICVSVCVCANTCEAMTMCLFWCVYLPVFFMCAYRLVLKCVSEWFLCVLPCVCLSICLQVCVCARSGFSL